MLFPGWITMDYFQNKFYILMVWGKKFVINFLYLHMSQKHLKVKLIIVYPILK